MAALDFPATPTVGQKYPVPAVVGVPVYTWDGEKWTTIGGAIGSTGGADDPPLADGTATAGVSTQWAREDHVHPRDASLAYSGMQINGGMEVSQERGTTSTTVTSSYICDGWKFFFSGTMITYSGVALLGTTPPGFSSMLYVSVATGQASLGSGDHVTVNSNLEGYRTSRLAWGTVYAQPITICFWSAHHRVGLYSIAVRNGTNARSYVASYTHAVADVAQYNVVTVPGDTTGTWDTGNTMGLSVTFTVGSGSSFVTPTVNTWQSGNYFAAPGQVNAVAATSDAFRITGVTILPGTQAPTAAQSPLVMRPFDQELITCLRYYEKSYVYFSIPTTTSNAGAHMGAVMISALFRGGPMFQVRKRAVPTVTVYNPANGQSNKVTNEFGDNTTPDQAHIIGETSFYVNISTAAGAPWNTRAVGTPVYFHWVADARL